MAKTTFTTERAVFDALRNTYEAPAYAVLPGVANGTGSHKSRTIDAVFMSLWPSRGLALHGVEIKVSRNDWTRELADPAKQEAHFKHLDHFWLAVGDESIVREGELPETWGLLVPARTKLKVIKPAPLLKPDPMTRAMLAAILRRANEHINSGELRASIRAEVEAAVGEELARLREQAREHQRGLAMAKHGALMARFCERAGVHFDTWNSDALDRAADFVKTIGVGGYRNTIADLRRQAMATKQTASRVAEDADSLLADLAKLEAGISEPELITSASGSAPSSPPEPSSPQTS
jgi:hypothetical protein